VNDKDIFVGLGGTDDEGTTLSTQAPSTMAKGGKQSTDEGASGPSSRSFSAMPDSVFREGTI
jgi:hypothetical protein